MIAFDAKDTWVILGAVVIDVALGEVPNRVHPVVGMGTLTRRLLQKSPLRPTAQLIFGVGLVLIVAAVAIAAASLSAYLLWSGTSLLVEQVPPAFRFATTLSNVAVESLLLSTLFAGRGLIEAGVRMRRALTTSVAAGREALSHLCSRDPSTLTEADLCGATVESLSENTSDSFVAPLFWYMLCECVGAPGLCGAALYRSVNTMDAMIGYRGKYEYLGKFAARLDDVLNWIPARVSSVLLVLSAALGALPFGFSPIRSVHVLCTDHARTESPNAGWPMAAAAGALRVELNKANHYTLGKGLSSPSPTTIAACERLVSIAGMLWLCAIVAFGYTWGGQ